ncbi:unnamed protein product [Chondrus crispus]|uniref:Uncharacterized protein n=1 Tax=Chondrus crispus TaxID=2769 RepID=R7QSL3_CHOCR|nr:unnamed protein product [Chondrus crispus]CDF40476.1 unnamed protein product [Chondrus crispus]|eukprot:XP_005710770.1 unnamed protein product [Chondrus crispus]
MMGSRCGACRSAPLRQSEGFRGGSEQDGWNVSGANQGFLGTLPLIRIRGQLMKLGVWWRAG